MILNLDIGSTVVLIDGELDLAAVYTVTGHADGVPTLSAAGFVTAREAFTDPAADRATFMRAHLAAREELADV